MADGVRIRLLGGFEASAGERRVPADRWRLRKARTLVKLLALGPGHTLHVEQVGEALWPDRDAAAVRNNLHQAVHAARRALSSLDVDGARLLTLRDDLLSLGRDAAVTVDVDELRAAVAAALRANDVGTAGALLTGSASDLLPEDAYESWLRPHADAFREWRTAAVLEVAAGLTVAGDAHRAVALLVPVTAADPIHEPAARALMRALSGAGRRAEALQAYDRLRTELREQLGTDPEPESRTLFRDLLAGTQQPVSPGAGPAPSLPAPVSSVVGRARELDELATILRRTRLLTLTGMGGVGKTTIAVSLAHRIAGDYRDGAHLVELGTVRDGDQVAPQVATALRLAVPPDASPTDAIVTQLRSRRMLLLLDNCEHLLDACAPVVTAVLRGCPDVRVLATSREALRVDGEVSWRTPSLRLPQPGWTDHDELRRTPSVALFVDRADAVLSGFTLTDENAAAVATICHRLDGIPLALELAAALTPMLSPAEIAARLGDAMGLLRRGDRSLTRQQTLEATLTWSHDLLSPSEQVLFRRIAVFAGPFGLDAVEAVCADGLRLPDVVAALARLVDTSLIVAERRGPATRFRLLETVRQYASQRLRESREQLDVERRHCAWSLQVAAACDPEQHGLLTVAPATLDSAHDDMRAALAWSLGHDPPLALELCVSLWRYWLARGFLGEGRRWIEAALEAAPRATPTRARALLALAAFDIRRGRGERLRALAGEAVAIERTGHDRRRLGRSLVAEAAFLFLLGAWGECWDRSQEARTVAPHAADIESGALQLQGVVLAGQGRLPEARLAFDEVRAMLARLGETSQPFLRPVAQGFAIDRNKVGEPRVYFEETVFHGRVVDAAQADAHVLCSLADVARAAGDLDEALDFATEAEVAFRRLGDVDGEAVALGRRGCLHRLRAEHDAGRDALVRALALRETAGERRAAALTRTNLALLAAAAGDVVGGRRAVEEQIARAREIHDAAAEAGLTLTLASLCADTGDDETAAELLAAAVAPTEPLPGCHLPIAWGLVMQAGVLRRLGRTAAADSARDVAGQRLTALGVHVDLTTGGDRPRARTAAKPLQSDPS